MIYIYDTPFLVYHSTAVGSLEMDYICKIASMEEMERKWNAEIDVRYYAKTLGKRKNERK